jgi:hypothetical protein
VVQRYQIKIVYSGSAQTMSLMAKDRAEESQMLSKSGSINSVAEQVCLEDRMVEYGHHYKNFYPTSAAFSQALVTARGE